MRATVYSESGSADVLRLVDRPEPVPGPGEVRMRVHVSGVNPTGWKALERGAGFPDVVPDQDGAGVVDAVGPGLPQSLVVAVDQDGAVLGRIGAEPTVLQPYPNV